MYYYQVLVLATSFFNLFLVTYVHVLKRCPKIKKEMLAPNFDPANAMLDFEHASMNTIKNLFPTTILHERFFFIYVKIFIVLLNKIV